MQFLDQVQLGEKIRQCCLLLLKICTCYLKIDLLDFLLAEYFHFLSIYSVSVVEDTSNSYYYHLQSVRFELL